MVLLDLPELTFKRRKRRPCRLGDVQRTRVVPRFSGADAVGLIKRQIRSAHASISTGRCEEDTHIFRIDKEAKDVLVGLPVLFGFLNGV